LGYSIAVGILGQKKEIDCKSLYLTKRNTASLNHLEKVSMVKTTTDNRRAVKYSNVIILAVQPAQLKHVLEEIQDLIEKRPLGGRVRNVLVGDEGVVACQEPFLVHHHVAQQSLAPEPA